MGKVGKTDEVRGDDPLLLLCPVRSPAAVLNDGKCSSKCMWHTARRRIFGGKLVFDGCDQVWLCRKEEIEF